LRKQGVLLRQLAPRFSHRHGTIAGKDFAVSSADFPSEANQLDALIRKRLQGRIVNGWLMLVAVAGGAIVVADGLTRGPYPELELLGQKPLEYQPNHAAFLLALVTLPLMFAYARKARVPLSEGLFLWFIVCTIAYTKDFSYLRLPGAPLFITDVVFVVLLFSIYILPRPFYPRNPLVLDLFCTLFFIAGVVSAARGLWGHGDPVLVLRDCALVAYSFFLLVGYQFFRSWLSIKRLAVWFLLGTALNVLNGVAWFFAAPEQRRFVLPGIYALVSLVFVLVTMANRLIRPKAGRVLAVFFSLGLLLANTRSVFISLGSVLLLAFVVPGPLRVGNLSVSRLRALVPATVLVCASVFLFSHLRAGSRFTTRVADELASGVLHSSDDPYWQFRLAAWKEAWRRFEEYPTGGEGFGIPFVFDIYDNDARPHNTFLTVLYKMGLIGFLPLFALLAYFFWYGLRAVHRNLANRRIAFLQIVILAQLSFCVYGGASFVLESPYLAWLFWAGMGVGFRMIRKFEFEQSLGGFPNRAWLEQRQVLGRSQL